MPSRAHAFLVGAGLVGAMVLLAPAARAIDALGLEQEQIAAHNGDAVRAVAFAADGAGEDRLISGGEDAQLRSWTLQLVEGAPQALDYTIYDVASSPDGSIVATGEGGWNGSAGTDTLRIWSPDGLQAGTGAPIGYVYVVAVSPDKNWTAASGFDGDIVVYDTATLVLHTMKVTNKKRTKDIVFSPDGRIIATSSKGGAIQLWSFPQATCTPQSCELALLPVSLSHAGAWDVPIALAPDSTAARMRLVSGTDAGVVRIWTIENLADPSPTVSDMFVDSDAVRSLAWSPDRSMIAAGGDGDITVYDADTLEILSQDLNAHAGRVNSVVFSPDSTRIASAGNDGALRLWHVLAAPGVVPDGTTAGMEPMRLARQPGGAIELSWSDAQCSSGGSDFAVYEGQLSDFTSHLPVVCSTSGATTLEILPPAAGNTYYLVVPLSDMWEGSYGLGASGERPGSAAACRGQLLSTSCPPSP
jgi:WD40 repeat protein